MYALQILNRMAADISVHLNFFIRVLLGVYWLRGFVSLKDDADDSQGYKKEIEGEMLPPAKPSDDAAAGTGNIAEGV